MIIDQWSIGYISLLIGCGIGCGIGYWRGHIVGARKIKEQWLEHNEQTQEQIRQLERDKIRISTSVQEKAEEIVKYIMYNPKREQ